MHEKKKQLNVHTHEYSCIISKWTMKYWHVAIQMKQKIIKNGNRLFRMSTISQMGYMRLASWLYVELFMVISILLRSNYYYLLYVSWNISPTEIFTQFRFTRRDNTFQTTVCKWMHTHIDLLIYKQCEKKGKNTFQSQVFDSQLVQFQTYDYFIFQYNLFIRA